MPPRRRVEPPPRRWPPIVLLVLGVLAGAMLWAYAPTLPPDLLVERYADERSRFLDIGGARAHVREEGNPDGMPIVLLHGSLASLHVWEGWTAALKDRARLISVDLPGHGLTGAWPRDEYTIDAYADFVEVLVDVLHLDRFAIVGHSMGGAVAWTFAATRPDRVSHLILVDAAGYPRQGEAPLSLRVARLPVLGGLSLWFHPEMLIRRSLKDMYADPKEATPERVVRYSDLQRFPGNREAMLQRLRTQEPLDPTPLKRLNVPTMILWGAKDRWSSPAIGARFQRDIKGARLKVLEKLGHNPMEEDPIASAVVVDAFLPASLVPPAPLPAPPAETTQDVIPPSDTLNDAPPLEIPLPPTAEELMIVVPLPPPTSATTDEPAADSIPKAGRN
ncbi:MAG: alpha/beta hydrolase [Enhydrobacter sp.]|nr:MAG: alpha/beta hydrolase [Enhydrobacter sp.]